MQENNRNSKGTGEPSARRLAMDSLSGIAGGRYGSLSVDAVLRRSALEGADRGLYAALVFGVLERQTTLDFLAEQLSARPPEQLDLPVLLALRLGLYQLIYMDRVPDYAAIGEPVSSDYAPSCLGEGEDGNLYYDGFTVYTYRDDTGETVSYVE